MLAVTGDPRSTRVGGVLRKLHIDEIPQFLNVIRGEMSIIGPRPERPHFTVQYDAAIPHYDRRTLHIKPGLSGLSQVTLGYDDSLESVMRKHDYDLIYWTSLCGFRSFVKMEFFASVAMAMGFVLALVPGATPKNPASGLMPRRLPFLSGRIHAMSSPTVHTFQPFIAFGGMSIAKLVLPHADGNAAAT